MNSIFKILLLSFIISCVVYSQVWSVEDSSEVKFRFSIEQKEVLPDFILDTVDIFIHPTSTIFKGYALKICAKTDLFTIQEVIPGDFYNECNWEFYSDKQIITDFSAENYLQVWEVIALAEIFADSITPTCYQTDIKKSVAKLIISKNIHSLSRETAIPIFFLWEDCSDNTIAGESGNDLFVSDQVFHSLENQPLFEKNKFPTTFGIPQTCLKPSSLNSPVKNIDFVNGGIIIKDFELEDSLTSDK